MVILKGGKSDKVPLSKLNKTQLGIGIKVELEHTKDKRLAKKIAADHLAEQYLKGKKQDYYTRLKKMEAGFVDVKKGIRGDIMAKKKKRPCPGSKIRSKGAGRGLGIGAGKGPIGRRKRRK